MKKNITIFIFLFVVLSSCINNPNNELNSGKTSLTIDVDNRINSENLNSSFLLEVTKFEVNCLSDSGIVINSKINDLQELSYSLFLDKGIWQIEIKAFHDDVLIGYGNKKIDLTNIEEANCLIIINPIDGKGVINFNIDCSLAKIENLSVAIKNANYSEEFSLIRIDDLFIGDFELENGIYTYSIVADGNQLASGEINSFTSLSAVYSGKVNNDIIEGGISYSYDFPNFELISNDQAFYNQEIHARVEIGDLNNAFFVWYVNGSILNERNPELVYDVEDYNVGEVINLICVVEQDGIYWQKSKKIEIVRDMNNPGDAPSIDYDIYYGSNSVKFYLVSDVISSFLDSSLEECANLTIANQKGTAKYSMMAYDIGRYLIWGQADISNDDIKMFDVVAESKTNGNAFKVYFCEDPYQIELNEIDCSAGNIFNPVQAGAADSDDLQVALDLFDFSYGKFMQLTEEIVKKVHFDNERINGVNISFNGNSNTRKMEVLDNLDLIIGDNINATLLKGFEYTDNAGKTTLIGTCRFNESNYSFALESYSSDLEVLKFVKDGETTNPTENELGILARLIENVAQFTNNAIFSSKPITSLYEKGKEIEDGLYLLIDFTRFYPYTDIKYSLKSFDYSAERKINSFSGVSFEAKNSVSEGQIAADLFIKGEAVTNGTYYKFDVCPDGGTIQIDNRLKNI